MAASDHYHRVVETVASNPLVTGVCATAVVGVFWAIRDYVDWKAFGTGGTPPTWLGYLRMTRIRLKHALSTNNLLDASHLDQAGPSYLPAESLPIRSGPRPTLMTRILPQRQRPEPIGPATHARLSSLVRDLAAAYPHLLEIKPSRTEGGSTDGLYARSELESLNPVAGVLKGEIAHVHPQENSLHVWLSERDAREVVEKGWGVRFPPLSGVPRGWVMVYAPRGEGEMDVVEGIVRAAVRWVVGVEAVR
ncbi:hypothetical protein BO71DRAFT_312606 [Aspergillus ellipticus CBS 707.79]|uniref:Luciferase domain-containing protein n=1 Tax=Aspergillus ellipticus CBS 707.79 TaxID=1448320 RepID=A0A319DQY9_9EURO|nr:hypothetical protein BO71DRAFT_312606 [Aspergillus ellipticus CBS 707.79]